MGNVSHSVAKVGQPCGARTNLAVPPQQGTGDSSGTAQNGEIQPSQEQAFRLKQLSLESVFLVALGARGAGERNTDLSQRCPFGHSALWTL